MSMFKQFWKISTPDHINEEGVKWWLFVEITRYAKSSYGKGLPLNDISVWVTELQDGYQSFVVVDETRRVSIYESQQLESILAHIDMMRIAKAFG